MRNQALPDAVPPQDEVKYDREHQALPPELVPLLAVNVFEEDTGEVSPRIYSYFQITKEERPLVRREIAKALEQFKAAELKRAKLVSTVGERYIKLADCSDLAKQIFEDFSRNLGQTLGSERTNGMKALLKKQLREGGRTLMEVGVVKSGSGQLLLSKRLLDSRGIEISMDESTYLKGTDLSEFARWDAIHPLHEGKIAEGAAEASPPR
ncbi:hypothetical protein [Haloferula sp. BvORR071]|uniref:hypothetical protein n=1 Tax=Haloferula sp. BvORR071 TaxID=1396141 RepID=UPI0022410521|nr:hypothetical protein [Haloferula sp. BvORR071]